MTEIRRVHPKDLLIDPENPRKTAITQESRRRLAMNISRVGIIHPPVVREMPDGTLRILAGHRRVDAAIYAGLEAIDVMVRPTGAEDVLVAVSENMIREGMSETDQWRCVRRMREELGYSDQQLCSALMVTPTYLKRLCLLARLHPPILHAIEIGRGPDQRQRKIIAQASLEEQAHIWGDLFSESVEEGEDPAQYRLNPDDPDESVSWWQVARALECQEYRAEDARFDEVLAQKHGVVWREDLFAPAGAESRYTLDGEAYEAAQRAWLAQRDAEGIPALGVDDYGHATAPEGYRLVQSWQPSEDGDCVGYALNPRDLTIIEQRLRAYNVSPTEQHSRTGYPSLSDTDAPKTRPELTKKGHAMIGTYRSAALREAIRSQCVAQDPWTLIAALLLALNADNVHIRDEGTSWRQDTTVKTAVKTLFPEGDLVRDETIIRAQVGAVLASFMNCEVSAHSGSGKAALLLGCLFEADRVMPHMAHEDFLKAYSKAGITAVAEALTLEPQDTGKATRAAVLNAVGGGYWVPEVARFASTKTAWSDALRADAERAARDAGVCGSETGAPEDILEEDALDPDDALAPCDDEACDDEDGGDAVCVSGAEDEAADALQEADDQIPFVPGALAAMKAVMGDRFEIVTV
ncbi:ParB/RepB/Spo0J family partition protein [Neokomagataea anthophila]|uniref:ParB/RepB/Spo0J family partition protein n=1 Tax=Neokomagataea anthophila TaxID=2826925 RepID=A0ABS5E9A2_9PROT|nr:ParB/RepB/Spo0J family partition protein [Neokomagataea anthophila]MBR0560484.1 ParB/RepB/Spo0J family partition protein [Neokomagataea anthophila]